MACPPPSPSRSTLKGSLITWKALIHAAPRLTVHTRTRTSLVAALTLSKTALLFHIKLDWIKVIDHFLLFSANNNSRFQQDEKTLLFSQVPPSAFFSNVFFGDRNLNQTILAT